MPVDCIVIISLHVFSDRFNFEKLLQHFSQRDFVKRINSFAGSRVVTFCYFAEHDASLSFCSFDRHLVALADGDSPVGSVNPLFMDVRFGLRGDSYCKARPRMLLRYFACRTTIETFRSPLIASIAALLAPLL